MGGFRCHAPAGRRPIDRTAAGRTRILRRHVRGRPPSASCGVLGSEVTWSTTATRRSRRRAPSREPAGKSRYQHHLRSRPKRRERSPLPPGRPPSRSRSRNADPRHARGHLASRSRLRPPKLPRLPKPARPPKPPNLRGPQHRSGRARLGREPVGSRRRRRPRLRRPSRNLRHRRPSPKPPHHPPSRLLRPPRHHSPGGPGASRPPLLLSKGLRSPWRPPPSRNRPSRRSHQRWTSQPARPRPRPKRGVGAGAGGASPLPARKARHRPGKTMRLRPCLPKQSQSRRPPSLVPRRQPVGGGVGGAVAAGARRLRLPQRPPRRPARRLRRRPALPPSRNPKPRRPRSVDAGGGALRQPIGSRRLLPPPRRSSLKRQHPGRRRARQPRRRPAGDGAASPSRQPLKRRRPPPQPLPRRPPR